MDEFDSIDWQIIKLKSYGLTTKQIGAMIKYSPRTIKNRLLRIYDVLDVGNGIQMLRKLHESGIDVWTWSEGHECSK